MPHLFLSYRRDDSAGFAGRLADALETEFGAGSVFRDVDDILPGEDFVRTIHNHMADVAAILVMIGPRWLTIGTDGRRRLDIPQDFVRREIEAALASGKPVIPLLVGGAAMPAEADLPETLSGLARRQAVVLSDAGWRVDVRRLVESLRPLLRGAALPRLAHRLGPTLALAVAALAILVWAVQAWRTPPTVTPPPEQVSVGEIAGRWTARVKYDWGDEHEEVFEFGRNREVLHGTATYLTRRLAIEQPRLEGGWLSFVSRSQEMLGSDLPPREVIHRYKGQVTADAIRFTLESGGGYTLHPPVEFVARRATAADPSPK